MMCSNIKGKVQALVFNTKSMVFTIVPPLCLKRKGKHRNPKDATGTVDFALISIPSSWILPAIMSSLLCSIKPNHHEPQDHKLMKPRVCSYKSRHNRMQKATKGHMVTKTPPLWGKNLGPQVR